MATNPNDLSKPLEWKAPGPGMWNLDRSHVNRPATPISQYVQSTATIIGSRVGFMELGAPLEGLDFKFVNGLVYSRVRPLIKPDKPAEKLPPKLVLKLLIRVHPEMRRRAATAARVLEDRPWRKVLGEWTAPGGIRERYERANLEIQEVDLSKLSNAELGQHMERTINHALEMWQQHFRLHNHDLGPIGLLLDATAGWNIEAAKVIPLLEGASPSTSAAEATLRRIREAVEQAGASPATIDELRSVSPRIASDLDEFLRLRGHLVVSRYDIDGLTLAEAPSVLLNTILSARDGSRNSAAADAILQRTAEVRELVPESEKALFDLLLQEARAAMDLRDDNGPHTLEWPLGLMRIALLEVGRRMQREGRIQQPELALELEKDEVAEVLAGAGPSGAELMARQQWRQLVDIEDAPRRLGTVEPVPPMEVLPKPMASIVGFIQRVIAEAGLDGEQRTEGLNGVGIGTAAYRGIARVAGSPEDALMQMVPGDVLVVPCTTPAFNMVLSMAGAVVTAEGGALSHAAVLARELGIPGVIGAPRAMSDIPDGVEVEVDPVAGVVRVVGQSQ